MKQIIPALLVVFTIYSCNNPKANITVTTTDNEKLVKEYFDHFNHHHWDMMAGMYTENADFKDPSLGQGIVKQSRQQVVNKYSELNKVFPDIHDSIVNIYPSGEKNVIVEFVSTGTAPDGSKFELPICTIFTIENGLISKDFTYYDNFEDAE
ncbi:nuclear transport factor 2 family protein [Flavobacterium sp. RHBU_3]|uniref:nuclear transport factor 2 family protein n=1 Tax=Flavobacterium sp. RHBU_3 TaxID=3391184 RepID=UPI003984B638